MAVMRTDLGDQLQSDGRLPVASRCVGPQPATGTSGNVTACRTVAFSTGGESYGETKQLAALPDSGCKGSLAEWPAGGAIIASSPDNGGCRAGCKEFCDWHGTGRAISKAWQQICDSGVCCPGGLDSASGGVRAIHSLAPCAFRSLANAESLRPPVVPRACRPLQPDALCQRHGRRDVAEGAKAVRGAGGLLRGGLLRRGAAGREHRGRALGAARHLRPGVCDA